MKFKLKGITWEIRLALRRAQSVKNEIVVSDIKEIYEYLAKYEKMDEETVKKAIEETIGDGDKCSIF